MSEVIPSIKNLDNGLQFCLTPSGIEIINTEEDVHIILNGESVIELFKFLQDNTQSIISLIKETTPAFKL